MALEKPFTDLGSNRQSPTVDDSATLLVGSGIDTNAAGTLTIGGTNATAIAITPDVEFTGAVTFSGTIEPTNLPLEFSIDSVATTTAVTAAKLNALADGTEVGLIQKRTVTIGHADLTDADGEQSINIGAVLPANAMVLSVCAALATPFSGGGAASVLLDVGTSGDPDAIVANCDLFAAAVDGMASTLPAGVAPFKIFTAAGAQLLATIAADVNVANLSAGSVVVTVSFVKIA